MFCGVTGQTHTRTPGQQPPTSTRDHRGGWGVAGSKPIPVALGAFGFTRRAFRAWIPVWGCTECLPINTVVACGRFATIRSFPLTNPTRRARRAHTLRCFVWGCTLVMRGEITFERCTPNVIVVANTSANDKGLASVAATRKGCAHVRMRQKSTGALLTRSNAAAVRTADIFGTSVGANVSKNPKVETDVATLRVTPVGARV